MQAAAPRRGLGLFAAAYAFLLPVVFSPSMTGYFWTPRAALCVLLPAIGLPLLWGMRRTPAAPAAGAAVVLLVVAAMSAARAPQVTTSVVGLYDWGTGLLFVAALVGAWAVGASLDERERSDVVRALLLALAVNVVVALAEMAVDLQAFHLGRFERRSPGLLGNPVYLGAFVVGGLALVIPRFAARRRAWALAVVGCGAAVQVSGSRFALVVAAVMAVLAFRRWGARTGASLVIALAVGVAAGSALSAAGGGTSLRTRVQTAEGYATRLHNWASARHAVADHPLLGSGPGRYRTATSRYRTIELARAGPDKLFLDAHNLGVEYLVTTGALGFAALGAWLLLALRAGRGPLLAFASGVLALHLVEPQFVGLTPVAFLALGAAGPLLPREASRPRALATAALLVPAVAAAAALLLGDFHLEQARLDFSRSQARAARALLPRWSEPASLTARIFTFEGKTRRDPALLVRARAWRRAAVRRDPTDPALANDLAEAELASGLPRAAARDFEHALRYNPWSTRALMGLARATLDDGHPRQAVHLLARARRLIRNPELTRLAREARQAARDDR